MVERLNTTTNSKLNSFAIITIMIIISGTDSGSVMSALWTPAGYAFLNVVVITTMFFLSRRSSVLLLGAVALTSIGLVLQFIYQLLFSPTSADIAGFIKVMAVLPFGLGALSLFASLPSQIQKRHLRAFNMYVNVAVLGNIGMMVFVPSGGTLRGMTSRIACSALLVWLVKEIARVDWHPSRIEDGGIFVYTASPLDWVFFHALYRVVLMSLPVFNSTKYVAMEPATLVCMYAYYWTQRPWSVASDRRHPANFYFGAADTLVVATMGMISFSQFGHSVDGGAISQFYESAAMDWAGVAIHAFVTVYAVRAMCLLGKRSYKPAKNPAS